MSSEETRSEETSLSEREEQRNEREIRRSTRRAHRHEDGRRHRSFFWPTVLIGVGVVWLLNNLGIISEGNLSILFRLWPMFLILIGLDVLFGRGSRIIGGLIGLLAVAAVVGLLIYGSELGLEDSSGTFFGFEIDGTPAEVRHWTQVEPVSGAESASIDIEFGIGEAMVSAITGDNLLEGDVTHIGTINFEAIGGSDRRIKLTHHSVSGNLNNLEQDLRWEFGLNEDVPTDLFLRLGAGSADLQLADLMLTRLHLASGVGPIKAELPGGEYELDIEGGAGSFTGSIADDATLDGKIEIGIGPFVLNSGHNTNADLTVDGGAGSVDFSFGSDSVINLDFDGGIGPVQIDVDSDSQGKMTIKGGAGSITIDLPDSVGVRLEVQGDGPGGLTLPSSLRQVESGGSPEEGVWESDNFDSAEYQMVIIIEDAGVGPIIIR